MNQHTATGIICLKKIRKKESKSFYLMLLWIYSKCILIWRMVRYSSNYRVCSLSCITCSFRFVFESFICQQRNVIFLNNHIGWSALICGQSDRWSLTSACLSSSVATLLQPDGTAKCCPLRQEEIMWLTVLHSIHWTLTVPNSERYSMQYVTTLSHDLISKRHPVTLRWKHLFAFINQISQENRSHWKSLVEHIALWEAECDVVDRSMHPVHSVHAAYCRSYSSMLVWWWSHREL